MGQPQTRPEAPAATTPACHATVCATDVIVESCALDLGSAETKAWAGVQHPHCAEVLIELKRSTAACVYTDCAGSRPRILALLCFLADRSRSKDTVPEEIPEARVKMQGLLEVYSEISDENHYLTCPDLGRCLSLETIDALKAQCVMDPDVQVVVSDGLSADAIIANYEEILSPLFAGLKQAGLKIGTSFLVCYGHVKIEGQVDGIPGAKVVIPPVGEHSGLGQSESLSCYVMYFPQVTTTVEADRICISNIHQNGTPPAEAAAAIVDLAKCMPEQRAFSINMSRQGGIMPVLDLIRPSVIVIRVIVSVNDGFVRELKLPLHIRSLGLITADSDDMTYIAADEATRQAVVEVVYGRSLYTRAAHDPSPTAGEMLIMLGDPNPAEVRAGLNAMMAHIESGAALRRANDVQDTALLAHVVLHTGSYLSSTAGIMLGDPTAYLMTPSLEVTYGIDAAMRPTDVQLVTYVLPPPETNYSTAFLIGNQVTCKAACDAFTDAVLDIACYPVQRAQRRER